MKMTRTIIHGLNISVLSGPYYTAVDLAQHAHDLDEAERITMAEGDINSDDYVKFMNVCVILDSSYNNDKVGGATLWRAGRDDTQSFIGETEIMLENVLCLSVNLFEFFFKLTKTEKTHC